ncbi:MAG: c-type cytochrome [Acidobacteriaceae bacterium]|nr:c-type cytochrome [Acidobacteriaceae bacterium]
MRSFAVSVAVGTSALAVVLTATTATRVQAQANPAASPEYYTHTVKPILLANCYRCHAGMNHRGALVLDSKKGILHGGKDGAVLIPGDPANSMLIKLIRHEGPADDPMPMPPKGKLSDADIAAVTAWVKAGAPMPDDQ